MKKILSIILAISLIMTLLPSFAYATETETTTTTDPVGTLEYLPAETSSATTFTLTARNTQKNYTPGLNEASGVLYSGRMRTDRFNIANGAHPIYAAYRITVEKAGVYMLSLKNGATDEEKRTSTMPAIYFFPTTNVLTSTEFDGENSKITAITKEITALTAEKEAATDDAVIAEIEEQITTKTAEKTEITSALAKKTLLSGKTRLGYFDLSKAANAYEYVTDSTDGAVRITVSEPGDYFVVLSPEAESLKQDGYVFDKSGNVHMVSEVNTAEAATYFQQMNLAGIKLTPVTEMYFDNEAITSTKVTNEETQTTKQAPVAEWTVSGASGWTANADLSRVDNYGVQSPLDGMLRISLAGTSSNLSPWHNFSTVSANNSINARKTILAVDSTFGLSEGAYKIKFTGGKISNGGRIFIYVDEKYAGVYDCYDASATSATIAPEVTLNTLKLTPGEDGKVNVSFRLAEPKENERTYAILSKLTFEKVETAPTAEKIVIENAPEALEAGASAPFSAYVMMSDGSKYYLNGIKRYSGTDTTKTFAAVVDEENYIDITVSDNLTFVADYEGTNVKNGVFTNADGKATGTVTANGNGEATITVNATVDGVALTPVTATVTLPEVEEPGEEITDTVTLGVMANYEDATSGITSAYKGTSQVAVGTSITAKANDVDGYKFAYWKDGSRYLSSDNEITVTVARNTALTAVYDVVSEETTAAKVVEFWNADKTLISKVEAEGDTVALPANPTMTGYEFIGWYTDEETKFTSETVLTADVTRVVAQYELDDATYTVTVDGAENTGKYDAVVEKTAGDNFTYWTLNDAIMSFNKALSFLTYGAAKIESVKDDAAEAAPTIVLDKVGSSFFIAYETPAGYERIETGIIFGNVEGITVNACESKASAKNKAAFGQFTAKPLGNEREIYARGYQIFKKDGKVLVIYTDAIEA